MSLRTIVIFLLLFSNVVFAKEIVINEIAWMGTENSANDEWIELFNKTEKDISLEGFSLFLDTKEIKLEGIIKAHNFYILERTDDGTLPKIKADLIYTGSMKNTGLNIFLKKDGVIIDKALFENGFNVGDNETKQTAERINESWQTSLNSGGSPQNENIEIVLKKQEESSFEIKKEETLPLKPILSLSILSSLLIIFTKKQLFKES
ncbi:MAG: lamin tail domain-containing protein [Candidatus Pacebacteria bacterium]|nr:lamin tail domain-containing protein [Candidatus Paceibacterota bacterium]